MVKLNGMKKIFTPKLIFIISMAIFGTIGWFIKYIPLSSGEISLYRAILASLLILAFLLITKQKIPFNDIKKQIPLLFISGVAMGFNWVFLFEAYNYTTISVATLSYYFAPVIVTIACSVIFKEKMTVKNVICFIFSTVGLVLITGIGDLSSGTNHLIGVALGLGAACFYAFVVLVNKKIKGVDGIPRTFIQLVSSVIVLIPYCLLTSGFNAFTLNGTGWVLLLTVGLLHTGFTYCLYFSSLKELKGGELAILSYIDPLIAVIISVAVLSETLTILQAVGGLLILGFTLLNEIKLSKKEDITNLK